MDDFKSIISMPTAAATAAKTVDNIWNKIVAGAHPHHPVAAGDYIGDTGDYIGDAGDYSGGVGDYRGASAPEFYEGSSLENLSSSSLPVSLSLPLPLPFHAQGPSSVEPFGMGTAPSNLVHKGRRRVVEEPMDKATLQKQRRMIKNRESAARSRERKQAYTLELEYKVQQLEQENTRLVNEETENRRQRRKQLMETIIPVEVMRKPKKNFGDKIHSDVFSHHSFHQQNNRLCGLEGVNIRRVGLRDYIVIHCIEKIIGAK